MSQDAWVASLSNGDTVVEHWIPGESSPWARLINLCKDKDLYLTNLRLTICSKTVALKPHASAYWQMHQCTYLQGKGQLPVARGIGFVDGNVVKIVWGIRTDVGQPYFWSEERSIDGQECIIWSPVRNNVCLA